tara:strand:- start:230 stop:625 length:396 start_codon:yes stop_codon:yes gene_type:complete
MKHKVVRHHNYPKALESEPEGNKKPSQLFYFCFFELDNGRKICIQTYKTYNEKTDIYEWNTFMTVNKDGEDLDLGEYSDSYADEYNFGEDFSDWFDRTVTTPATVVTEYPTDEEYKCVIDYYDKEIKLLNI